jgi:hypothetical protein
MLRYSSRRLFQKKAKLDVVFETSMFLLSSRRIIRQKNFEKYSNSMSFFGSQCCGKGMRGVFAFEIGSESEPRDEPIR